MCSILPHRAILRAKKWIFTFCILSLISWSMSGCFLVPKEEEVLAPPIKEPPKIVYNILEVKKGTFELKTTGTGYLVSAMQKDLFFGNVSGRLKGIYVRTGDIVEKGTLLADLISDDLEEQLQHKEIALKKAKLNMDQIKNSSYSEIEILENKLALLKENLHVMQEIEIAYTPSEIESIKNQIKEQEAVLKNKKNTSEISIQIAENDIKDIELQVESLKKKLNDLEILSPVDGVVDYIIDAKEGDNIDTYRTVVRVADPNNLQIQYTGNNVNDFELGMEVNITVSGNHITGKVIATPSNMPADADEKTRNSVRISMDKIPENVRIGETADISLVRLKKEGVIVVPKSLLRTDKARTYVHVLENNTRQERDVELGSENITEVVIEKGLSEGDKIIRD